MRTRLTLLASVCTLLAASLLTPVDADQIITVLQVRIRYVHR
jgi:hypothetical protein